MAGNIDKSVADGSNVDFAVFDPRCEELGIRLYSNRRQSDNLFDPRDIRKVPQDYYDALRFVMMIPQFDECVDSIPAKLNFDLLGSIDLKKGCFLGQELTARAYYTGVVRKRPYLVIAHPPDYPIDPVSTNVRLSLMDPGFTANLAGKVIKDINGRPVITILGTLF